MYYAILMMLFFEGCVFLIHFWVMTGLIEKMFDFGDSEAMVLSAMWGVAASLTPLMTIYGFYWSSGFKETIVTMARKNSSGDTASGSDSSNSMSGMGYVCIFVLLVLIGFETAVFFGLFKEPGSFYGGSNSFAWGTLMASFAVTMIHIVVSSVIVGVFFAKTHEKFNNFVIRNLGVRND